MELTKKLLPCSHCGSDNVGVVRNIINGAICWHIECCNCGIRTLDFEEDINHKNYLSDVEDAMYSSIVYAIDSWNTRVDRRE